MTKVALETVDAVRRRLAVERPVRVVTDADVDRVIERLRQNQAQLVPITDRRVAQRGDVATVDYEATLDTRVVGRGERRLVEVGGENGPGAHLEGVEIGVPASFELDYPSDHENTELAGQRVQFRVVIAALARRDVPPLDDAFAKSAADCETVAAFTDRVREQLTGAAHSDAEAAVRSALIERLVTSHDFEVPSAMVERRLDALVEEVFEGLGNRRPPASREAELRGRLRSELHDRARDQVKATLVLDAIAAQEHLAVDDETLEARIERVAASAGQARERVRAIYNDPSARAGLRSRLLQERALDLVIARATISDVDAPSGVAGVPGNG